MIWHDIASAPKDGTQILVKCSLPTIMAVVFWMDSDDPNAAAGWHIWDGHNDPIWFRANPYICGWMPCPDRYPNTSPAKHMKAIRALGNASEQVT